MKRPRQHVLEEESRLALKNLLPSSWLKEDIYPDYGLDMRITIVEGEEVTTRVFCVQIKATDGVAKGKAISLPIDTKNLTYYEKYPLPVFLLYYLKPMNVFYYVFSQKYIRENLLKDSPRWRKQQTTTITFSPKCVFKEGDQIDSIVVDSALYLTLSQLNEGNASAIYWIDGIPKSDDQELKALTLKALDLSKEHKFRPAIDTFERILRLCTVSPTERMSILVSIGNAYDSLSLFEDALNNFLAAEKILPKTSMADALAGKACIFSGLGRVYSSKSRYPEAIAYHRKALKLFRKTGYTGGEAGTLNNIGIVYREQGDPKKAVYSMRLALKLHQSSKDLKGQAIVLGNIGNTYNEKGNLPKALEYYRTALKMHRKLGNLGAEANMLGSIGIVWSKKGDSAKAIFYFRKALKIFTNIEELEGQAITLQSLANVYYSEHNNIKAMQYALASLGIYVKISNRHGEALSLATIGNICGAKGDLKEALRYCRSAEAILIEIGEKTHLPQLQRQISDLRCLINIS